MSLRGRAYVKIASVARYLPRFRGRSRIFLELHRMLGLRKEHVVTQTTLQLPVAYEAELDLYSWSQRIAFVTGGYEPDLVHFLAKACAKRDGALLDIGANIGMITIPFARLTGRRVVAVEAVAGNAQVLRRNVARNGLAGRIEVVAAVLGDKPSQAFLHVEGDLDEGGTGTANIVENKGSEAHFAVAVTTLDSLSIDHPCCVVKIDTDGYDLKILQGATAFLARHRPVIFGEFAAPCLRWHGQTSADVVAFGAAYGYETWQRCTPSWTFSPAVDHAQFELDLLLVPSERRDDYAEWLADT